jgi:hypothetical protein
MASERHLELLRKVMLASVSGVRESLITSLLISACRSDLFRCGRTRVSP